VVLAHPRLSLVLLLHTQVAVEAGVVIHQAHQVQVVLAVAVLVGMALQPHGQVLQEPHIQAVAVAVAVVLLVLALAPVPPEVLESFFYPYQQAVIRGLTPVRSLRRTLKL
jgi:hypothetical protein